MTRVNSTSSVNSTNSVSSKSSNKSEIPSQQIAKLSVSQKKLDAENAPKRSWFANLFNFKGMIFVLRTSSKLEVVVEELKRCLNAQSVKFQPGSKDNTVKCKYDGQDKTGSKSCKYRIEINPFDNEIEIAFVHQQGSGSSFKSVFEIIKNDLKLDDKKLIPQQPAQ